MPFSMIPESAPVEVYKRCANDPDNLELLGRIGQKLTLRRELADSISDRLQKRAAEDKKAKEDRS